MSVGRAWSNIISRSESRTKIVLCTWNNAGHDGDDDDVFTWALALSI